MNSRTAYICFCVEGRTEITALKNGFQDLFDSMFGDQVEVVFREPIIQGKSQGDITTLHDVTPDNIEKNIYKLFFRSQDKNTDISWEDFTSIIHIIDIDGAYIGKDRIKFFSKEELDLADSLSSKSGTKDVLYYSDHIATRDKDYDNHKTSIENLDIRNERKRRNIEHLRLKNEISLHSKQPSKNYRMFYFCSNLDHVLFGNANMSAYDKMTSAASFAHDRFDAEHFIEFFRGNSHCKETDYNRSWEMLRKQMNSLKPLSNINILIDEILDSELEHWL